MGTFHLINAYEAKQRLDKELVQVVDIRDQDSFDKDHIEGAFHLSNASVTSFIKKVDTSTPLFVICYHGNSSKGVGRRNSMVSPVILGIAEYKKHHKHDHNRAG